MIGKYIYKNKINLRFTDFDSYGIAHHSKYLVWLEECRIAFINMVDKNNIWEKYRFLLTSVAVEYKKAVLFEDDYEIFMKVEMNEEIPKICFDYKIINLQTNRICATASTKHIITDNTNHILIDIPLELKNMMKNISSMEEKICT